MMYFLSAVGFVGKVLALDTHGIIFEVILAADTTKGSMKKLSVLERSFGGTLTIIKGIKLT